jgi:HlyD family secretion protein
MKKPLVVLIVVIVLFCGAGGLLMVQRMGAAQAALAKPKDVVTVDKGEILIRVVESGTVDAVKAVEVRSRASGRLSRLLADEGDYVEAKNLIAIIDPQETEFRVRQDRAQLAGASSSVARTEIEIRQQRAQLQASLQQAIKRVDIIKRELGIQPTLTKSSIDEAHSRAASAKHQRETLLTVSQPNQRVDIERALSDARNNVENSRREFLRQQDLVAKGFVSGRTAETAKLLLDLDESRLKIALSNSERLDQQQKLELQRANEDVSSAEAAYRRALAGKIQDVTKQREYEQAVLDLEKARASLLQVPILQKAKEQSASTVTQLRSVLDDSLRQLSETQVRAPFSGTVSKRYIEVGDLVTALSTFSPGTAIVRIEDRSKMRVMLEMNEIDVARITEGMKAKIDIDAIPGKTLTGTVAKIAPSSTGLSQASASGGQVSADAVVKYTVEVVLDSTLPTIRTGMTAKCTLDVVKKDNVVRIPIAYLGKEKAENFVMIAPEEGKTGAKAIRRVIVIGVNTGAWVEVLSGLKAGEKLVPPAFTGPKRTGFIQTDDEM